MEDRNGRARSALESMRRRQLEARRLAEPSPIAGPGTYRVMHPPRGREQLGPRRRTRVASGSDSFGKLDPGRMVPPVAPATPVVTPPRDADHTMIVAPRLYRAEIAPPVPADEPRRGWLAIVLALAAGALLVALALHLR